MEIRHVKTFLTLAEELHFGRTAARMHVVQSAVSQTLKALEREVGAELVSRTRRRVELTPAGRLFLEHSQSALASLERAANLARQAGDGQIGHLSLRLALLSALTPFPAVVARFRRKWPGVEIAIEQGGSAENLEALGSGQCDLALVTYRRRAPPFACEVLVDEPLVALLPSQHPLARRVRLSLDDLALEPRIVLSRRAEPDLHARYFRPRSTAPKVNIAIEADQIDTILASVAAGLGIAHAPASVRRLKMNGVVAIPFHPRIPSGTSVAWQPDRLSPVGSRFLDALLAGRREHA